MSAQPQGVQVAEFLADAEGVGLHEYRPWVQGQLGGGVPGERQGMFAVAGQSDGAQRLEVHQPQRSTVVTTDADEHGVRRQHVVVDFDGAEFDLPALFLALPWSSELHALGEVERRDSTR